MPQWALGIFFFLLAIVSIYLIWNIFSYATGKYKERGGFAHFSKKQFEAVSLAGLVILIAVVIEWFLKSG